MEKEHLAIIQEIMEEGFGKANLQVIDRYVSNDFIEHQFGGKSGKEGLTNTIHQLHRGLSNFQYELQNWIGDHDTVWTHYKATALQSGPFMDSPPSNKEISIDIMDIFRFKNDLLIEHWGIPDRFAALIQLNLLNKKQPVS